MPDDSEPNAEGSDTQIWTKEELTQLINPTPMTGKEIVEAGWLGG
jgi:hypothetical protein